MHRKRLIAAVAAFFIFASGALFIYGMIESRRIRISHVVVRDDSLAENLKGRVVVLMSDLHLDGKGRWASELLGILKTLKPDILFLTGDYVPWKEDYKPALSFMSELQDIQLVWAVLGDYDYSTTRKSCLFCHEPHTGKPNSRHTVRFLRNSWEARGLGSSTLWIGGVDNQGNSPKAEIRELPVWNRDTTAIVLSHNPLAFDIFGSEERVLILAGDTHGGQIPLPSWFWRLVGYDKNAKYEQGWFEEGKKKMYVSRGIGTSHIPIRIFRPPEITVFHFERQ
jgi:predicted MPP superfamily phosphohydrolase